MKVKFEYNKQLFNTSVVRAISLTDLDDDLMHKIIGRKYNRFDLENGDLQNLRLVSRGLRKAVQASYMGPFGFNFEDVDEKYHDPEKEITPEMALAFAMASHSRLGGESLIRQLDTEIINLILKREWDNLDIQYYTTGLNARTNERDRRMRYRYEDDEGVMFYCSYHQTLQSRKTNREPMQLTVTDRNVKNLSSVILASQDRVAVTTIIIDKEAAEQTIVSFLRQLSKMCNNDYEAWWDDTSSEEEVPAKLLPYYDSETGNYMRYFDTETFAYEFGTENDIDWERRVEKLREVQMQDRKMFAWQDWKSTKPPPLPRFVRRRPYDHEWDEMEDNHKKDWLNRDGFLRFEESNEVRPKCEDIMAELTDWSGDEDGDDESMEDHMEALSMVQEDSVELGSDDDLDMHGSEGWASEAEEAGAPQQSDQSDGYSTGSEYREQIKRRNKERQGSLFLQRCRPVLARIEELDVRHEDFDLFHLRHLKDLIETGYFVSLKRILIVRPSDYLRNETSYEFAESLYEFAESLCGQVYNEVSVTREEDSWDESSGEDPD